jgi:hypothetical protein
VGQPAVYDELLNLGVVEQAHTPPYSPIKLRRYKKLLDNSQEENMAHEWEDGFVKLNEAQMHYYHGGTRGKAPLILAHGFSDMGLCWESLARELEDEFDIFMPDARGHGCQLASF